MWATFSSLGLRPSPSYGGGGSPSLGIREEDTSFMAKSGLLELGFQC